MFLFNLFERPILGNLSLLFSLPMFITKWIYEFTKHETKKREQKICHFLSWDSLSAAKMQFVAAHSNHAIETYFQVSSWSGFRLFLLVTVAKRTSDWCRLIYIQQLTSAFWISILFIDYSNDVDVPIKVKSVQRCRCVLCFASSCVCGARWFCGRHDKSRSFFPAKNTFYLFNSW